MGRFIPGIGYVEDYDEGIIPGGGYVDGQSDASGTTVSTTPANSTWAGVSASIDSQTIISTTPATGAWASVSADVDANTQISTTPPNAVWAAVAAVIETGSGDVTIVTTPDNSTWSGVAASINAKHFIETIPDSSVWAGVSASINASTIIETTPDNSTWTPVNATIETAVEVVTTPANSTWAGVNGNVSVISASDEFTGGWTEPKTPTKKEVQEERERLGIIPKKPKQITKLEQIPVKHDDIATQEQVESEKDYLKDLREYHEQVRRRGARKAERETFDKEILNRIALSLEALETQRRLIEERDIIFVIMTLAA